MMMMILLIVLRIHLITIMKMMITIMGLNRIHLIIIMRIITIKTIRIRIHLDTMMMITIKEVIETVNGFFFLFIFMVQWNNTTLNRSIIVLISYRYRVFT